MRTNSRNSNWVTTACTLVGIERTFSVGWGGTKSGFKARIASSSIYRTKILWKILSGDKTPDIEDNLKSIKLDDKIRNFQ